MHEKENLLVKYFHGGPNGIQGFILPPNQTGVKSLASYSSINFCDTSKVYVATDINAALLYASRKDGVLYEVEPIGELLPDPDYIGEGVSFMCSKAKIIKRIRVSAKTKKMARKALAS